MPTEPFPIPPSTSTATALASLHHHGCAVIPGALPRRDCAILRDLVEDMVPIDGLDHVYQGQDLLSTIFNRSPHFLPVLDLVPIIDIVESALGDDCHIVNQKAWRAKPGHVAGALHVDRLFVPLPEELSVDSRYDPPYFIISALVYLCDIDEDLCPTLIVPGSHRSGRAPHSPDDTWLGRSAQPVHCRAGDALLFRSDLWHCGSVNRTTDRTRHVIETVYGLRDIAHRFWPYVNFTWKADILAAANPRQARLMGKHSVGAYG